MNDAPEEILLIQRRTGRLDRYNRRVVLASIAVAAGCAGGAMLFASGPGHIHKELVGIEAPEPKGDTQLTEVEPPMPTPESGLLKTGAKASRTEKPGYTGSSLGGQDPMGLSTKGASTGASTRGTSTGSTTKAPNVEDTKASTSPKTSQPAPSGPVKVSGQVSCSSGKAVKGVWVEAAKGRGWSPWKGVGDGSNADYWYTLPTSEQYSLHIGCGGTPSSWAVAVKTPSVGGTHNSFNCFDVPGEPGYGTCRPR